MYILSLMHVVNEEKTRALLSYQSVIPKKEHNNTALNY